METVTADIGGTHALVCPGLLQLCRTTNRRS